MLLKPDFKGIQFNLTILKFFSYKSSGSHFGFCVCNQWLPLDPIPLENDIKEKVLKVLNIINIYTGEGEANCEILIFEKVIIISIKKTKI